MDYLAEFYYKEWFLGKTNAVVTVPLIVGTGKESVQPGRVYRVVSVVNDEPMFDGYLVSVTHKIAVETEGGMAMTTLQFSHVRAVA